VKSFFSSARRVIPLEKMGTKDGTPGFQGPKELDNWSLSDEHPTDKKKRLPVTPSKK
jgi:hypothetical protein